jgi:hypothetical protein
MEVVMSHVRRTVPIAAVLVVAGLAAFVGWHWTAPGFVAGRVVSETELSDGDDSLVRVEIPVLSISRVALLSDFPEVSIGRWVFAHGPTRTVAGQSVIVVEHAESLPLAASLGDFVPAPVASLATRLLDGPIAPAVAGVSLFALLGVCRRLLAALVAALPIAWITWHTLLIGSWSGWWQTDGETAIVLSFGGAVIGAIVGARRHGWVPFLSGRAAVGGSGWFLAAVPAAALGIPEAAGAWVAATLGALSPIQGLALLSGSLVSASIHAEGIGAWLVVLIALGLAEVCHGARLREQRTR